MNAKRWLLTGLFAVAIQAGFALPVMADDEAGSSSEAVAVTEPMFDTLMCHYLALIPDLPQPFDQLLGCEFLYLANMSAESRALFLLELSQPYVSPESLAEAAPPASDPAPTAAPRGNTSYGGGVEQWRGLVEAYFRPEDVDHALSVIDCESIGGNPAAVNPGSGASGLFQHMPRFWAERSAAAGWDGADIFNPEANVAVAAWLVYSEGWGHWPNCG